MSDVTPPPPPPPPPTPPVPPPPGDQPPGYGPPPGAPEGFDVGAAFSWGWKKLQENLGPILIAMLVYVAITFVVVILAYVVLGGIMLSTSTYDPNTGTFTGGTGMIGFVLFAAVMLAIFVVMFAFLQAAIVRGAMMIADGKRLEVGHMFSFDNFGTVFVAALIVAGLTLLGVLACYVGALVVGFFTAFFMFFLIDKRLGAWESVVASFNFVKNNIGQVFLLLLLVYLLNALGSFCVIALIITAPLGFLAMAYGYRRLQGEPVAP